MPRFCIAVVSSALAFAAVAAAPAPVAPGAIAATAKPVMLKKGSRGKAVRALQRRLRITADGIFGPATRRAVIRFQRRKGLTADGIAGPVTLRALGLARIARRRAATEVSVPRALSRIARCESGGDPRAVSADGRYRGKYQFSRATWRDMGGEGDPARASEAEQDRRALRLYRLRGAAPWPSCARRLGLL